jgi:hypothetical protein
MFCMASLMSADCTIWTWTVLRIASVINTLQTAGRHGRIVL